MRRAPVFATARTIFVIAEVARHEDSRNVEVVKYELAQSWVRAQACKQARKVRYLVGRRDSEVTHTSWLHQLQPKSLQ
tara:strand:- start:32 stop:265 length:234 start_codon:yes stop_codon:yes gene_type:complete